MSLLICSKNRTEIEVESRKEDSPAEYVRKCCRRWLSMKIYGAVESKEGHEADWNTARLFTIFRRSGIKKKIGTLLARSSIS